jgi:hypothetical protein
VDLPRNHDFPVLRIKQVRFSVAVSTGEIPTAAAKSVRYCSRHPSRTAWSILDRNGIHPASSWAMIITAGPCRPFRHNSKRLGCV